MDSVLTVAGFSFAGSGQNSGMAFIKLKDWSERKGEERSANAIIGRAMGFLFSIKEAQVFAFNLPPFRNSARPPASTSSCRTVAVWVTRS